MYVEPCQFLFGRRVILSSIHGQRSDRLSLDNDRLRHLYLAAEYFYCLRNRRCIGHYSIARGDPLYHARFPIRETNFRNHFVFSLCLLAIEAKAARNHTSRCPLYLAESNKTGIILHLSFL